MAVVARIARLDALNDGATDRGSSAWRKALDVDGAVAWRSSAWYTGRRCDGMEKLGLVEGGDAGGRGVQEGAL
jgi:hypothetical protein